MARVSVCLLCFNQAEYLRDAIESVLTQTFADWELIVVDNGSTDGSRDLLESYRGHPKIRLFLHDTNEAPTRRLNEAVAASSGELVSLLYSDDFYLPDKLQSQVTAFDALPDDYGVVYSPGDRLNVDTGERWTDPSLSVSGWILDALLTQHGQGKPINPISPLVKRACLTRHRFHEDLFIEGEFIYLRIAMTHRFHFIPQPTVVMRDHERNWGRAVKRNVQTLTKILDKLEQEADFPAASLPALKVMRVNLWRLGMWLAIRVVNDPVWARQMMARTVRLDWRQALHPKVVAGLGLSLLGAAQLRRLNQFVATLRPTRGHSNYVDTN